MAAARGLPIPPPDQIPPELQYTPPPDNTADGTQSPEKSAQLLTVPTSARPSSAHSEVAALPTLSPALSLPSPSPVASGTSASPLFRSRAKTLAALTHSNKNSPVAEPAPQEFMLPPDPFVNGQPIEAYLYKDASECPICFLYYPPYLNRTRCCDQPICSECFVQIKRPDPHPPEHAEQPGQNADAENGDGTSEEQDETEEESQLISEPSSCPFCVQPEFGVTYAPPQFRRGLSYAAPNGLASGLAASPVSSSSSLGSMGSPAPPVGRRRATSLSASDPSVITTDKIRPDWAQKLANARAHAARRSAAATALHTAAYLMHPAGSDARSFGRRGMLRRTGASSSGTQTPANRPTGGSPALHALAFLSERRVTGEQANESSTLAPPRESSRRSRIDDLEEMMMMEAIRMSLASEEERRRKEEKELRKEAKKKEKEAKKAEKIMRKNAAYNTSQASLAIMSSGASSRVDSSSSSFIGEDQTNTDKGKKVDRTATIPTVIETDASEPATNSQKLTASADSFPPASPTEPSRPSHLRQVSSASSTSSSYVETVTPGDQGDSTASASNPALEPMFNFRSLAAVIGDEDKSHGTEHAEHIEDSSSATADTTTSTTNVTKHENQPSKAEDKAAPIESQSPQEHVSSMAPKELNTHSVEVSRETTV